MFDVGTRRETLGDKLRKKLAERPGKPIDGGRLLRAVSRRKVWVVGSVFAGLALGLMIPYWLLSHEWTSRAIIEWEQPGESAGGPAGAVRDLRTLVDSVKLPTNLAEVRDELGLRRTLNDIGSNLEVSFDRDSNVVAVNSTADTPELSARIANAVVDRFLEHQGELAQLRSQEQVEVLRQQAAEARQGYDQAAAAYDSFRREHGISDLSLQRQHAIEMAAQLQSEAELARAEATAEAQRVERLRAARGTGVVIRSTPALQAARRELEHARGTLSDQHPRVRALRQRVSDLESEAGNVSLGGSGAGGPRGPTKAQARSDTYESLVLQARTRLGELSAVESQASQLLATVQVKEMVLAEAESALTRAQAQATTTHNGFRLLAPALPPEEPSSSNRRAMAVFILLGCIAVTILVLLLWELRGLRAHTANEVAFWGRAPVLGATTWPRNGQSITPLIEELGDFALEAGGTTLVLPASDEQRAVASEVAERLHLDTDLIDHSNDVYRDPDRDLSVSVGSPYQSPQRTHTPEPQPAQEPTVIVMDGYGDEEDGVIPLGETAGRQPPGHGPGSALASIDRGDARAAYALAHRREDWVRPRIAAWNGAISGPPARRAARVADRVIVIVPAGGLTFGALERLRQSLGREEDEAVGYLVVGVRDELATLPDRAGPVESFWRARRAAA